MGARQPVQQLVQQRAHGSGGGVDHHRAVVRVEVGVRGRGVACNRRTGRPLYPGTVQHRERLPRAKLFLAAPGGNLVGNAVAGHGLGYVGRRDCQNHCHSGGGCAGAVGVPALQPGGHGLRRSPAAAGQRTGAAGGLGGWRATPGWARAAGLPFWPWRRSSYPWY